MAPPGFVYNAALTSIPASRGAVFSYFEPVVAVVLGVLLLNERLSAPAILGASIIAFSVVLLQREHRLVQMHPPVKTLLDGGRTMTPYNTPLSLAQNTPPFL